MKHIDSSNLKRNKLYLGYSSRTTFDTNKELIFFKYRSVSEIDYHQITVYSSIRSNIPFMGNGFYKTRNNLKRGELVDRRLMDDMTIFEISFDEFAFHVVTEII